MGNQSTLGDRDHDCMGTGEPRCKATKYQLGLQLITRTSPFCSPVYKPSPGHREWAIWRLPIIHFAHLRAFCPNHFKILTSTPLTRPEPPLVSSQECCQFLSCKNIWGTLLERSIDHDTMSRRSPLLYRGARRPTSAGGDFTNSSLSPNSLMRAVILWSLGGMYLEFLQNSRLLASWT